VCKRSNGHKPLLNTCASYHLPCHKKTDLRPRATVSRATAKGEQHMGYPTANTYNIQLFSLSRRLYMRVSKYSAAPRSVYGYGLYALPPPFFYFKQNTGSVRLRVGVFRCWPAAGWWGWGGGGGRRFGLRVGVSRCWPAAMVGEGGGC